VKSSRLILIIIFVLSWLTLPLLGREAFKKYLPSAIFMCILTKVLDEYGKRKKWWRFYKGIPPLNSMDIFNIGPYFITSLWVLKLTYGKFPKYFMSNTILHILFIFHGIKYIQRLNILSLVKLTKVQYLLIDAARALILYGFQYIQEKIQACFHSIQRKRVHSNAK